MKPVSIELSPCAAVNPSKQGGFPFVYPACSLERARQAYLLSAYEVALHPFALAVRQ